MRVVALTIVGFILFSIFMPLHGLAQEREWQLDAQDEDAYLIFGVPNTADIGISLWCKIGQKTVSVFAPMPPTVKSDNVRVVLQIEEREYPLKPKFNADENNASVEAELHPSDKILSEIAAAERIGLQIADHKSVFPTEGANFFEFNKLCAKAPVSN